MAGAAARAATSTTPSTPATRSTPWWSASPTEEPGLENPTVTPIPGDVVYFSFNGGMLDRRFKEEKGIDSLPGVIDLAIFYGRNNLLLNGDVGWVPGNVYATIVEGLDADGGGVQ